MNILRKADPWQMLALKIDMTILLMKLGLHNGKYEEVLDM